jgi:hypothetical protein
MRVGTVAIAVAMLATACGGGGKGSTGAERGFSIEAIAAGTIAARTAHVEGTISGASNGSPMKGTFAGDADFSRNASDVKIAYSGKDAPESTELLLVGGALYLRIASLSGGKYLKMPTDIFFGQGGSQMPLGMNVVGFGVADPVGAVKQLRAIASEVRDLGRDQVRGIDTAHEQLAVKMGALFPCPKKAEPARSGSVCDPATIGGRVTVDIWVDDQSRMIRLEAHFDLGGDSVDSRVDYSAFGDPVDISAPPKSTILDESSFPVGGGGTGDSGSPFGKHTTVTGPWVELASGSVAGVRWSFASAPAEGAVCPDFVTTPPLPMPPTVPAGPIVTRDGRGVNCVDPLFVSVQEIDVVASTGSDAQVAAVAGVVDASVSSLVAHFADGTTQPITIDVGTRTFVWVGVPAPRLVSLTADSKQGPVICSGDPALLAGSPAVPPPPGALPSEAGYFCLPTSVVQGLKNAPSSATLVKP